MNCRIDWAFVVGAVLDGVVAGVREGMNWDDEVRALPFWDTLLCKEREMITSTRYLHVPTYLGL